MSKTSLLTIAFILLLIACNPAPGASPLPLPAPDRLTFMAGYKPQANLPFVGVYLAQSQGFFADENLEVAIQHSPGQGEHLQLVTTGKVDVTTQDAAVLLQRRADPGLPLVSIALIGQRGQQAFAALASSGLKTPKDWENHTVGYKGTPPPDLLALLAAAGADPAKVAQVNVGFDPRILTEGGVDVYPVFKSNEPFLIRSWGYDLVLWDAADYGVPTLGLAYVTSQAALDAKPDLLTRFLRASLRGIAYAAAFPDEAVDVVLQYTGPETDPAHMRFMLDAELLDAHSPLTDTGGLGWQSFDQWQALADMLVSSGVMSPIDVSQAFTTEILEAAALAP